MIRHARIIPLAFLALLCLVASAVADPVSTSTLHDPTTNPLAAINDVSVIAHAAGWVTALFVGAYLLVEVLAAIGKESWGAVLGRGRVSVVIAGATAVLAAAINAIGLGGGWGSVIIAAGSAAYAYWHPAGVATDPARTAQAGSVRLAIVALLTLLAVPVIALAPACTHAQVVAGEDAAKTCGLSNAGSILGILETALSSSDWESAITSNSTLSTLSTDALTCLIKTVVAVIDARDTGSGSAVSAKAIDPIVLHGNEWLAKHGAK